jgi:hypothetical protein
VGEAVPGEAGREHVRDHREPAQVAVDPLGDLARQGQVRPPPLRRLRIGVAPGEEREARDDRDDDTHGDESAHHAAAEGHVQGVQGGEFRGKVGRLEIEDRLPLDDVAELVATEQPQGRIGGHPAAHLLGGRPRQQCLPPVARREEPCNAIQGGAEIVAAAMLGCPGVDGHPHADPGQLALQHSLSGDGCLDGGLRRSEHRAEGIAHRLEDRAAVALDHIAQERIVTRQRLLHLRGIAFP